MPEIYFRKLALWLLRTALAVAPSEVRPWGEAMLAELRHVEGSWTLLSWALGGLGVLLTQTILGLFRKRNLGTEIAISQSVFVKEGAMGKVPLVTGATCVVASVLFFFAPAYRQAFQLSLGAWYPVFHVMSWSGPPGPETLAKQAEAQHDAEGLAFAAVRIRDDRKSVRLAEEAVRLDPRLLWVYAIVAVRHPLLPEISKWLPKLERWDPQNALFPLIAAESIDIHLAAPASRLAPKELQRIMDEDPGWRNSMAAVFEAPKFDDYLNRLRELDRRVVVRYGFNDPVEVLDGESRDLPTYAFWDSQRFAKSELKSGEDLEAQGDRKGAVEKYWTVARFGQVIDAQAHTDFEHYMGSSLQAAAYKNLRTVSEKEGNQAEAALFTYLAGKSEQSKCPGGT